MATLQQVAERAGVALSTVSFVLNNSPRVSDETRRVVMQAVSELNYTLGKKGRPRRAEGSPKTPRRRKAVGFLFPFTESSLRTNITYMTMVQGAEVAAAKSGQDLMIRAIGASPPADMNLRIDGAIAIFNNPLDRFHGLASRMPIVRVMGVPEPSLHWDQVTYNNAAVGPIAARYLLERGHRHCAYYSPYVDHPHKQDIPFCAQNVDRQKYFIEAFEAAGGTVRLNTKGLPNDKLGFPDVVAEIMKELLLSAPRPTALFVPADHFITTVYGILYAIGIRPGVDVDVISCNNDIPLLQGLHPRPAAVDLHIPTIGAAGVEQLLRRIENPDRPFGVMALEPTLVPATYAFTTPQ